MVHLLSEVTFLCAAVHWKTQTGQCAVEWPYPSPHSVPPKSHTQVPSLLDFLPYTEVMRQSGVLPFFNLTAEEMRGTVGGQQPDTTLVRCNI